MLRQSLYDRSLVSHSWLVPAGEATVICWVLHLFWPMRHLGAMLIMLAMSVMLMCVFTWQGRQTIHNAVRCTAMGDGGGGGTYHWQHCAIFTIFYTISNSACPNKWKTGYFGGKNIFQSMILVFQNYNFCFGPLTTTLVLYLGRPAENCAKYLELSAYRAVWCDVSRANVRPGICCSRGQGLTVLGDI